MKIPFSPSVYEHAAALIERSPWDVSRDPDLLFAAHRAAFLQYHHAPIVVGIDIYNLETEAYGARISTPTGNGIPAICDPLLGTLDQALDLRPFDPQQDGRISLVIKVGRRLADELPEADVRIPVPCIMGGDTIHILDDILATGTGMVVCDVATDQPAFIERARATHPSVKVRVNMDPGIAACDCRDRIYREVDRIVGIAAHDPNCLMGTGCLPYETPPKNIRLIRDYLS